MPNIPGYNFKKIKPITDGLSGDRKYYLETEDGQRLLARIAKESEYERKQSVFRLLIKAAEAGLCIPEPIDFGYCENGSEIYTLLTWVDGVEAAKRLPKLPPEEQYKYGIETEKILRKFHDASRTD